MAFKLLEGFNPITSPSAVGFALVVTEDAGILITGRNYGKWHAYGRLTRTNAGVMAGTFEGWIWPTGTHSQERPTVAQMNALLAVLVADVNVWGLLMAVRTTGFQALRLPMATLPALP